MVAYTVDNLCPRKVCWYAVCFFIEEVAPASDGLCQRDGWCDQVSSIEKADFFMAADKVCHQETENQSSMNSQTAASDIQNFRPVTSILFPAEDDIITPGADNGGRYHEDDQVKDKIRIYIMTLCPDIRDKGCKHKSASNQHAIPHNVHAEDGKSNPIRCNHITNLLIIQFRFLYIKIHHIFYQKKGLLSSKVWYNFFMKYEKIVEACFLSRPNRFIAEVKLKNSGEITRAHVKNTGRCRELLQPGAAVYLEDFRTRMGSRKMEYSLIGVEKQLPDGTVLLVNMDSQAPNKVTAEALADGSIRLPGMNQLTLIRGEKTYGDSRFDFYVEDESGQKGFIEVKGVTLEYDGLVKFPDAPTERGVKHLHELVKAHEDGYMAYVLFIVQMEGMRIFMPNDDTHQAFGDALRYAAAEGVHVMACQCHVTQDTLTVAEPLAVQL